ncbi:MAG: dockerin type I repeat-containing protein, partial [Gammaproteobacteria bacterium]|nr:dockerin type I repeat-containing protein [Gammaproteobacteria bacterium]
PALATQICVDPFVVSRRWARSPDVVHHGSGWTLVYHDRDDGSHEQIWMQRLDDSTLAPLAPRTRLSNSATSAQFPALGWNGTRYAVTWIESLRGAPGGQPASSLQFMRVEADGSPRRGPRPLETRLLGFIGTNEIMRPHWDGSHWGVFVPERAQDQLSALRFRRLDEDGNTVVGPSVVHEPVGHYVFDVEAAWQALSSEYGVLWLAQRDDGYQLLFQRVEESSGVAQLGSPASVAAWNQWDGSGGTSLIADPAGGWLAAWVQCDATECPVYTRRISAAGVPHAGGAVRVSGVPADEFRPRLAHRSGGYGLYLDQFLPGPQELARYLLDPTGGPLGAAQAVSLADGRASGRARLASDGNRVLAAWSESASTLEVAGRLAETDDSLGSVVGFTSGHDVFNSTSVFIPGQPRIVALDGGYFALWTEVQAGASLLAGRLYGSDGNPIADYLPFGATGAGSRLGLVGVGASFAAAWRAPGGLLRFTRRAADGSVIVAETTLATDVGGGQVELGWNGEHYGIFYPQGDFRYLRVDAAGLPLGAPQALALGTVFPTGAPRIAWLGDSWAFAWRSSQDGSLMYARIAADGTVLQAPVMFEPGIAPNGVGGDFGLVYDGSELGAVWNAFVGADPPYTVLYFSVIQRDGSLAFPPVLLQPGVFAQPAAQLHLAPDGFRVVYFADNELTIGMRELRLQRVSGGVNVVGSRFLANRGSASAATVHDGQALAMAWRAGPTQDIHIETDACLADPSPPACPVLAVAAANHAVRLSWPAVSDPQSGIWKYLVHRDGKLIAELPASAVQYDDSGHDTAVIHGYRVDALNRAFQPSAACPVRSFSTTVGDANGNGVLEVADIFYLNNFLLASGPPPGGDSDANGDGAVSAGDIFFIINYFFGGGPPPSGSLLGSARVPPAASTPDELALAGLLAAAGTQARVPVYVRDVAGTLLDEGDGPDHEIQSFAFQIVFPPTFVDAVTFVHAGVTAGRTAFFSQVTPGPGNLTVLKSFDEQSQPLSFTLDHAAPGDLIGEILIDIDPAAPDGSAIGLTLQAFNAALVDASATESETVANGHLVLRNASLVVGPQQLFRNGFE